MRGYILLAALCGYVVADVNPTCNRNNCLRALIGTSVASKDCSAFYVVTNTPPTVTTTSTIFETSSVNTVITQTSSVTSVIGTTKSEISTFKSSTTATVTSLTTTPITETKTITSFSTSTAYSLPTVVEERDLDLGARQVAPAPPKYASACSGVVKYSSACSCLGIFASTMTVGAAAPTTVIFQTSTISIPSSSTSITTQTVLSSTISTTVSTVTQISTLTTILSSTLTSTASNTKTTTIGTTVSAACLPGRTSTQFHIVASGAGKDGLFVTMPTTGDNRSIKPSAFTPNIHEAAIFGIGGNERPYLKTSGYGFQAHTERTVEAATLYFGNPFIYNDGNAVLFVQAPAPTAYPWGEISWIGYKFSEYSDVYQPVMTMLCPVGCTTASGGSCEGVAFAKTLDERCQKITLTAVGFCLD